MIRNPGILIVDGKIAAIKKKNSRNTLKVLKLKDSDYILPGIIDLHAHYKVHVNGKEKEDTLALPKIYLANGVTATFTAGELEPLKILDLKRKINEGQQIGPRILNSGPYFGKDANVRNEYWSDSITAEEIEKLVDDWVEKGIEGIKVKGINYLQLAVILEKADSYGLTVTGHFDSGFRNTINPEEAITLGVDRVEHFLGGELLSDTISAYESLALIDPSDPRLDKIIDLFIQNKVFYSPTLSAYGMVGESKDDALKDWVNQLDYFTEYSQQIIANQPHGKPFQEMFRKIYEYKKVEIKRFYDAGGEDLIVLGTDRQQRNGDIGGFAVHKEMEALFAAGIPAYSIIRIASINGAKALQKGDVLGSIEVGKWADLYITRGNPLENISYTKNVHTVIKAGQIYYSSELLNSIKESIGPESDADW